MSLILLISFLLSLSSINCASLLNIPIKSLTNSNIIYTSFNSSTLDALIINDRLDYNQFYIDLTILGKENKILKLSLDTTLNTNIFDSDSCPYCLDDPSLNFTTNYKGNTYKMGQFSADVLLNDDDDLILSDFPVNLQISTDNSNPEMPFDGVFGLGLDSFSRMPLENFTSKTVKPSNLLNYLFKNNYIENRQFSLALYKDANKTKLIMGGYDNSLLKTAFNYHPIKGSKQWALNLTGMMMIGNDLYNDSIADSLIFDSSVSNLIGPKQDVIKIIRNINKMAGKRICEEDAAYFMKCNCNDMPFFEEMLLSGIGFLISDKTYTFLIEDLLISYEENIGECNFALSYLGSTKAKTAWVAGTKFFERYYVVFNADSREIAIAEVNLDVLMGLWMLSQTELEILSIVGFLLFMVSLIYFLYILLKEGKSSKEFVKVNSTENDKDVSYLEDSDIFVIGREMKEIKKTKENPENEEKKENKQSENVENIEESHTI